MACEEVLLTYLHSGLAQGALASRNITEIVEALTDEETLAGLLRALDEEEFEWILERLGDFEHEFPEGAASIAVPVLLNQIGRLSPHSTSYFGFGPRFKALRIVYLLLQKIRVPGMLAISMPAMLEKGRHPIWQIPTN